VARELKDEKRRRWKAEDDVTDVQQKLSRCERQLKDKRKLEEALGRWRLCFGLIASGGCGGVELRYTARKTVVIRARAELS
jgi:hypothetical protein